jgi:hypothetical protein
MAGMALLHQPGDGRARDGTAGMETAARADCHKAIGQDRLEEAAEQRHDVEAGSAAACPAHVPGGARNRAVLQADETVVGEGDRADRGGEGGEGGGAVGSGLSVDVPGEGPALGGEGRQQARRAPLFFEEGAGEGGKRCDRAQAVGAGGQPGRAVLGEATAGHQGVEVRVVREWPTPGGQDPGAPRQGGPHEARRGGQPFEGRGRGGQQGLGREALMRAEAGT